MLYIIFLFNEIEDSSIYGLYINIKIKQWITHNSLNDSLNLIVVFAYLNGRILNKF